MDKKAIMAIAVLMTVGIMLGATGVGAWPNETTADESDEAQLAAEIAAYMQAETMMADGMTAADVADPAEIDEILAGMVEDGIDLECVSVMGCITPGKIVVDCITECETHCYIVRCNPCVYREVHAAIMWGECSDSNLDLCMRNCRGIAKSNADRTLTEEATIPNDCCGWTYINVHGTGTENNDLTESIAINNLFGETVPEFSTTKAYTGHCLGAAGALEAIISVLAIQNQEVYPNLRYGNPVSKEGPAPVKEYKSKAVKHVLSNSFGFGGCDTSLVFSEATK